jgi:hypothetical protein
MRFIIDVASTNSEILKAVLRSSLIALLRSRLPQGSPRRQSVAFPVPILRHTKLIEIGFLTAAYLLCFRELGYSWALQRHLEPIRDQLRNPTRQLLPPQFSAFCEGRMFDPPWIGIGEVAGKLALVAAIANHVVFLPPADRPHFYADLPDHFQGLSSEIRPLQFYEGHRFGGPAGILFGTRAVVVPDVMQVGSARYFWLYVPPEGGAPQIRYPLPDDPHE